MSVDPSDYIHREAQSSCCQAPVLSGGMCSECGEHCEVNYPEDEEESMSTQPYDSTADTLNHIRRVNHLLLLCSMDLQCRAQEHDSSKLIDPEKSAFDALVPKLKDFAYGSDEYRACLREMKPALQHHYASNRHHPEHFTYGVDEMTLLDVLEMLMDWKAASERMQDGGSILESIRINADRFGLAPQLTHLLINTAVEMNWCNPEQAKELFWKIGGVPPKA